MTLRIAAILLTTAMANPSALVADDSPDDTRAMQCRQVESQWVGTLVKLRDAGVSKERLFADADRIAESGQSRQVMLSRVRDVFLDPALSATTLSTYRVAKCLDGVASDDWSAFEPSVASTLLTCQEKGDGTAPSLSPCIIDLIDSIRSVGSIGAPK